jgi:hypothetical protein
MSICGDDRRHLVADELVVADAQDLDSTAQLIRTERVAIPGRGPDPSGDWRHIEQLLTEMQNLLPPSSPTPETDLRQCQDP